MAASPSSTINNFFTNLNELRIEWNSGQSQGTATADVPPHSQGVIEIPLPERAAGNPELTLKFFNRGELVDAYILPIGNGNPVHAEAAGAMPWGFAARLEQSEKSFVVRARDCYWEFDRKTGLLVSGGRSHGAASAVGGPYLVITPLELAPFSQISGPKVTLQPPVMNWVASSVEAQTQDGSVVIRARGDYPEYSGAFSAGIDGSGGLTVDYRFEFSGAEARVREVGLMIDVPADVNVLHWKHETQWSYYPDEHIGPPKAVRRPSATPPPGLRPSGDKPLLGPGNWTAPLREQTTSAARNSTSYGHHSPTRKVRACESTLTRAKPCAPG